jgi:hypothetical protein
VQEDYHRLVDGVSLSSNMTLAPIASTVVIRAGPEFGPELEGQFLVTTRALHGLKSSANPNFITQVYKSWNCETLTPNGHIALVSFW